MSKSTYAVLRNDIYDDVAYTFRFLAGVSTFFNRAYRRLEHYLRIKFLKLNSVLIDVLIYFSLFMIPFNHKDYAAIILIYCIGAYTITNNGFHILENKPIRVFFICNVVFLVISFLTTTFSDISFRQFITNTLSSFVPILAIALGYITAPYRSHDQNHRLVFSLIVIQAAFGILQMINMSFYNWSFDIYGGTNRLVPVIVNGVGCAVGTVSSPNYYGILMAILGLYAANQLIEVAWRSIKWWAASLVLIACLLLSASMTAIFCYVAGVTLLFALSYRLSSYKKLAFALASCIVAVAILYSFQSFANKELSIFTMSGREDNWIAILQNSFCTNTLKTIFGYGSGYTTLTNAGIFPDSFWINLLIEYGGLGLMIYILVWAYIAVRIIRARKCKERSILVALILVLHISDIFSATTNQPKLCILIYYLIGYFIYCLYNNAKRLIIHNIHDRAMG